MKKLILLAFIISLVGCDEVLIEQNRRIQIKGNLNSPEGDPIGGIHIISAGTYENYLGTNSDKILGRDVSAANGNFDFISLDTYSHDLIMAINAEEIDHDSVYSSLYFFDPRGEHAESYDLGELQLAKKVSFQFNIERTSQSQDTLRYVLNFQKPVKRFIYENGTFTEQPDNDNFISIRRHMPESEPLALALPIMVGTELVFSYSLGDDPLQRITIPISAENTSYDFEY
ncbi:hypothetical protein C8P64_1074 [Christiangramia gaetbulicola]|uniref:Uncharacterized protein n=1 Tax=Christiangramia gaetbulicola TaxID=703340 RepID=A0A2T6AMN8_9FLAO|nr:hypothetical protein [Christiangramia gaetbulicola]PTX45084.1 hypothetical protein C8P64_1074 [Christiangramia gaetbulicola]